MAEMISLDQEYKEWISSVSRKYRQSQIKAAVSVNRELIAFYWDLGRDISEREKKWGTDFYKRVSSDIKKLLPDCSGFSERNLRYMVSFYALYSSRIHLPQVAADLSDSTADEKLPQVVAEFSAADLFSIPWGHHRLILDRCKGNVDKAIFFVRKTIQNNWSRAVLMNFLDTDLYERQGKAISNFKYALPTAQSDLAQEMTKDPYNFEFLTIKEDYDEKLLKEALVNSIMQFLLELGRGFAFVGKEYPLPITGTEERIDLLFYHLWLHCYVVVEVKVKSFTPADIWQSYQNL